ncbi:MAG: hypothetical protein PHQ04_07530 [Opitutaceae bacterium]|nr:hypothetical protein [Opitutaceae bacterium]
MKQFVKVALWGCVCALLSAVGLGVGSCAGTPLPPSSRQASAGPVRLAVQTPDAGWRLRIERIVELERSVWILAQLERQPGPAAQVISTAQAVVFISLPAKPIRTFVAGKTWNWRNEEPYEFVPTLSGVIRQAGPVRVLFPAAAGK